MKILTAREIHYERKGGWGWHRSFLFKSLQRAEKSETVGQTMAAEEKILNVQKNE